MTIIRRSSSLVLVFAVVALTSAASGSRAAARQKSEPRVIEITAMRYAFDPAIIEVTEGESVQLRVKSADGLHGFEIKKFKISKEIPRGDDAVVINFTPNAAGNFPLMCSEYCGDGHGDMKGMLVVAARAAP